MTAEMVRQHDHDVYYCAACRETFTPSEADAATGIQDDGSTRCPNCNAILYAEPHLEQCKDSDDDPLSEATIEALNAMGEYDRETGVLSVVITDKQYEMEDDNPDSLISEVLAVVGANCVAEWTDYYEPRTDGRTDAAINIKARVR